MDILGSWIYVSSLKNAFWQKIPYSIPKDWDKSKPKFVEFPAEQTDHISASSMDLLLSNLFT